MKTNEHITTGLSITDKAVKFVQAEIRHQAKEVCALEGALIPVKSDEESAKALQKLLADKKPNDLGRLILSIPRNLATIHYVKLPSVKPDEIREMSRLQAAKQIPYAPEEIVLGHQIIQSSDEGYSDVVLIIVHQGIIAKYLGLLKKHKLEPEEITLDSQGIACWFALQKTPSSETPAVIVDLDSDYTRLDVLYRGTFIYSRAFTLDTSSPAGYKQRLSDEINRSLLAYEKEHIGQNPGKMFFTGASESLAHIDQEFLADFSSYEPQKYPQERSLNLKPNPKVKTSSLSFNSFASLLGITLSPAQPVFNLLPEDIRKKRSQTTSKAELYKTIILSCLIGLALLAGAFLNISLRQGGIDRLNQELRSLSAGSGRMEGLLKKINVIRGQLQQTHCLEILAETADCAGSEINLVSFNYKLNKPLTLKGQAKSLADVFAFVNNLEASAAFKDARLQYSSLRKAQTREIVDFEIVCLLEEE